jgi:hypothetical protein
MSKQPDHLTACSLPKVSFISPQFFSRYSFLFFIHPLPSVINYSVARHWKALTGTTLNYTLCIALSQSASQVLKIPMLYLFIFVMNF